MPVLLKNTRICHENKILKVSNIKMRFTPLHMCGGAPLCNYNGVHVTVDKGVERYHGIVSGVDKTVQISDKTEARNDCPFLHPMLGMLRRC